MTGIRFVRALCFLILGFFRISTVIAQAPNVSYASPQTYPVNAAIIPLVPANTGGAVPATAYGQVSTFAGSGVAGSADGNGIAASFNGPRRVSVDISDNVYVADFVSNLIRKITPGGIVTTLPISGLSLNGPDGIAVDAVGNIYVADAGNNLILMITPGGIVSTLAGSGGYGSTDGTGTAASFYYPCGISLDGAGNLYVTDYQNELIRKVNTSGGVVTTLAGSGLQGSANGIGASASFRFPNDVGVDGAGNVYVADGGNSLIRMITPGGLVSTFAGGGGGTGTINGIGTAATFGDPTGVTVDKFGNVYVADGLTNLIRKITPAGLVSAIAGSGAQGSANGIGVAASFYAPIGIAVDSKENLYVADGDNNLIRKIILTGYTIDKPLPPGLTFDPTTGIISGTPTAASPPTDYSVTAYNSTGSSNTIVNIAVGSLTTLVPPPNITYQTPQTYYVNTAITPLAPTNTGGAVPPNIYGDVSTFAGTGAAGNANGAVAAARFNRPAGLIFDGSGNLFVSETVNNDIREITPAGIVSTFAGTGTSGAINGPGSMATFNSPDQIIFDASGNMYVADGGNMMVRKITPVGVVSTLAGTGTQGSTDGTTLTATFDTPFGVAVDGAGNVYVADRGNSTIRKISLTGQVTTYAVLDGSGAPLNNTGLGYLAIDASGNLYFGDSNQVKIVLPSGQVNVIAGSTTSGSVNGTGSAAAFNKPVGIAVDALGNIYVGDAFNNSIRRITPAGVVTTVAGNGGNGAINGVSSTASFNTPFGVTIDNTGNFLYVADWGNNLIRKVAITGYSIDKSLPTGMTFDPTTGIISGTPAVTSPPITYTITAYNTAGSSATTVNIEVDEQTVTFPPIPVKTACDADFDPGATSAGTITYTSANTAVATIVAGELHITGPGTSVITASNGPSQPTQTLTVTAAVTPTITISPAAIDTCQGSAVTYSAVITNGGTNPVYQWQVNGQNIGSNSPTFTSSNLSNNDQITCILTSDAVCTTNTTAPSNVASFTVDRPAPPTITILSTATGPVCPGTELDFIATVVSPGNSLSYQWRVNGLNVGANSATFSSSSLANGDLVTCILTSTGKCLIDPTALSNSITVSINAASACIIVVPNAFTPNGDGVNDFWDINALQGYPQCTVNIFNRYGSMVYSSVGYPKAWDGTYGGSALPVGTYYYIIDLKNGRKKLAGPVTILR